MKRLRREQRRVGRADPPVRGREHALVLHLVDYCEYARATDVAIVMNGRL